jgi:hypothetical protein
MKVLTRDDILAQPDAQHLPREEVVLPHWDGKVYVRTLSGLERDDLEQAIADHGGIRGMRHVKAFIAARCVVDADGNRLFNDDDAPKLAEKDSRPLQLIMTRASRLNGFTRADIDDLAKNSDGDPSGGNCSRSASDSESPTRTISTPV